MANAQPRTNASITPVIVVGVPVQGTGIPVETTARGVPVGLTSAGYGHHGNGAVGRALPTGLEELEMGGGYTHEELLVLNYRSTVKCFAVLDGISTAMNLAVAFEKVGPLGLLMLIGPVMGYQGADSLDKGKVMVYVVFCCVKLFGQILAAVVTGDIIITLIAFLEMWITKIVVSFYQALRAVPQHRKNALRYAEVPVQYMYR
jgi:hypothetical protein